MEATIEQGRTLAETAQARGHTHGMRMMKAGPHGGDRHITWDPDDAESVRAAKQTFKDAVVAGPYNAFEVDMKPTRKGEPLTKFDPKMGEIVIGAPTEDEVERAQVAADEATKEVILTPPMVGG